MEAFVSIPLDGETDRSQGTAWYGLCADRIGELFDNRDGDLTLYCGGAAVDPWAGKGEVTWLGERSPSDLSLSFGSDMHFGETRFISESRAMTPESKATTLVDVSEGATHMRLACRLFGVSHIGVEGAAKALQDVVVEYASRYPVDFGNVAPDNSAGRTVLERALSRPEATARAQAREVLRGYSWTTLVPASLVRVVKPSLEPSTLLTWRDLPTGALLIEAGRSIDQYEESVMTELFERVAPVLPSGLPRVRPPREGLPPQWVVPRDARDVAPFYADVEE